MAFAMDVECNFFEDVAEYFEAELRKLHITPPPARQLIQSRASDVATKWFHVMHRMISPRPRRVVWSKELRARTLTDDQRRVVETIATELETAADLTPRMSKSLRKAGYNDGLLTDWGIHHLHVQNAKTPDGFVERDGPLLFVFIAGEVAHLLDLLDHDSFEDDDLIEIVHANWPETISSRRAAGFIPGSLSPILSPESRKRMRRKFVTGTQTKDGTIYTPLGGGVTLSGHSLDACRASDALLNLVHPAEVWVRENGAWIYDSARRNVGAAPDILRMRFETRLTMDMGRAAVSELQTQMRFLGIPPDARGIVRVGVPARDASRREHAVGSTA